MYEKLLNKYKIRQSCENWSDMIYYSKKKNEKKTNIQNCTLWEHFIHATNCLRERKVQQNKWEKKTTMLDNEVYTYIFWCGKYIIKYRLWTTVLYIISRREISEKKTWHITAIFSPLNNHQWSLSTHSHCKNIITFSFE